MTFVGEAIFYIFSFLSLYVQVFFLVTFLENKDKIVVRKGEIKLGHYPSVTVIVPSFNEENTIYKTVLSLLDLNYPKDKLKILLVDDGSTDGTWNIIKKFDNCPNIKIFQKENGGKYTALNLGLSHLETDFVGCLDADSFVEKESLMRIMSYFERDQDTMAVAPSIIATNSKNIVQKAQKAEYELVSVYIKKMLGFLGAIHITPGPFTIFKRKVFDDLGPYRHAYNTEDMEIACRMQKNHYKIEQCNDAYVYTNTPPTIKKLYKQRVRWIYGFINNTIDYRKIIFRKKYGNFSLFTMPSNIISIFAISYLFARMIYDFGVFLSLKITQFETIGFNFPSKTNFLDPFFINTHSILFISVVLYSLMILSIMLGKRMVEGKWIFSVNIVYFVIISSLTAPFCFLKAIYNTIISRQPNWR